jgi:hypothetical protein
LTTLIERRVVRGECQQMVGGAQRFHERKPGLVVWHAVQDRFFGRVNNPGALLQLALELSANPAGIADKRSNPPLAVTGFRFHLIERELGMKRDFGFARCPIKRDKSQFLGTDRTAKINRNFAKALKIAVREKVGQVLVRRAIQHQTVRTLLAVMRRNEKNCLTKICVA